MPTQVQMVHQSASRYATVADYHRIFAEEMESLYLLAFLLTADSDKAEQCFVSGLAECIDQIGVFMDRARSWARLAMVKHAIRMVQPAPERDADWFFVSAERPAIATTTNPFAAVISLPTFERFVFVMSVFEGQSGEDCQDLLKCSQLDVVMARDVAFRLVATSGPSSECTLNGNHTWPALLH
jgi:hypothetical protein